MYRFIFSALYSRESVTNKQYKTTVNKYNKYGDNSLTWKRKHTGMGQNPRFHSLCHYHYFWTNSTSEWLNFLLEHAVAEIKTLKQAGQRCIKEMSIYLILCY
jgi:hypothetical protein